MRKKANMSVREESDGGMDLRQSVEALAMRWVLAENHATAEGQTDPEWGRAVVDIRNSAEASGNAEVAGIAAELLACFESGIADKAKEDAVSAGILSLQQAIDRPPAAPASPEPPAPDQQSMSLGEDPELVSDFILESREHLQAVEDHLLTLEQDPSDMEAIHATFRGFHTIKGLAGFLGFAMVQEVSHDVETLLDLARNSSLRMTPDVIDVVLEGADYLKREIAAIEGAMQSGSPAPAGAPCEQLLAKVRAVISGTAEAEDRPGEEQAPTPESDALTGTATETVVPAAAPPAAQQPESAGEAGPQSGQQPGIAAGSAKSETSSKPAVTASAVKVSTAKLDFLVDMVGEMVIAQSLIRHSPELGALKSPRLASNLAQLARITGEIQKTAMSMRMVPVGQLFHKMARLVRDLSRKAGKQVEFETFGEDTELDRNIVEELADPLMHMVRNSIDHGIELPEVRRKAGKPAVAHVKLTARHQSGHILIEVLDDGRGIEREKVLAKAIQKGLIHDGSGMSDTDVFNLIFAPGFSTADQVTEISGRGVGMDVVQKHIQKLRGRIEVQSTQGRGTNFLLKVPLTLAIIDGLVLGVGRERYIIPIFAVKEMLRHTPEMISTIENRQEIASVRGRVLPLVRLTRRFGMESGDGQSEVLIIAESRGRDICLMADSLLGKQEVVIKSLGDTFKEVRGIAGGAILGDGRVGLIIDVDGIFWKQQQGTAGTVHASAETGPAPGQAAQPEEANA
jgi:two-component system chemotaxis sensor kinase CheA